MKIKNLILPMALAAAAVFPAVSQVPQMENPFLNASPGDAVEVNDVDLKALPKLSYTKAVEAGPQFLISDDPEYIRVPEGVALREKVDAGAVRLYVYNVNGMKDPAMDRKISVVIENLAKDPMRVHFDRYSFREPSANYFGVAKNAMSDYFDYPNTNDKAPDIMVPGGTSALLDPAMDGKIAKPDELVHALHEFTVDQPAQITILQTAPETPTLDAEKRLDTVLESPRKNAGRGKFSVANYAVKLDRPFDTASGPAMIVVADGKDDPWIKGVDSSTGSELELRGNYGVMYHMEIPWKSTDGRGLALVTWNDRFGSQWCNGMTMTVVVSEGRNQGGVVMLPKDQLMTKSLPEVVVIQTFDAPTSGKDGMIHLTYSPPGAACLPTPLALLPVSFE